MRSFFAFLLGVIVTINFAGFEQFARSAQSRLVVAINGDRADYESSNIVRETNAL